MDEKYLRQAISLAAQSKEPIGCGSLLVSKDGEIIAETFNSQREDGLTASHAEMKAIDLREYSDANSVKQKLEGHDLVWAMGGNTYMLRYEMQRSGFDQVIKDLVESGIIYGGDSAGALVAGQSIAGVESADEPEFAEEYIADGLNLIPYVVLPHIDNPEFTDVLPIFKKKHQDKEIIELKDSQAVIFNGDGHRVVEGQGL